MNGHEVLRLVFISVALFTILLPDKTVAEGPSTSNSSALDSNPKQIECYKCSSSENSNCNAKSPSHPAVLQTNCARPYHHLKGWIDSIGLDKIGIGENNLQKLVDDGIASGESERDMKDITGCIYFFASTKNKVTAGFDEGVASMRSFFGDKDANEALTVKEYVLRDCVTLRIPQEDKDIADRCVTIPGTQDVVSLFVCTCSTDKCNEGREAKALKGRIAEVEAKDDSNSKGNGAMGGNQCDRKITGATMAIFLVFTFILSQSQLIY